MVQQSGQTQQSLEKTPMHTTADRGSKLECRLVPPPLISQWTVCSRFIMIATTAMIPVHLKQL